MWYEGRIKDRVCAMKLQSVCVRVCSEEAEARACLCLPVAHPSYHSCI